MWRTTQKLPRASLSTAKGPCLLWCVALPLPKEIDGSTSKRQMQMWGRALHAPQKSCKHGRTHWRWHAHQQWSLSIHLWLRLWWNKATKEGGDVTASCSGMVCHISDWNFSLRHVWSPLIWATDLYLITDWWLHIIFAFSSNWLMATHYLYYLYF